MSLFTDFYRSQRWLDLRKSLMHLRSTDDGLICEYCHKPILKPYDAILHHKIELSPANVNNDDIAYNPDNLIFVHHACHNEIHKRFNGQQQQYQRKVFIVYGAPCSGKTTFVKANKGVNDLVLDIDSIWQCITLNERYSKPNALKYTMFDIRDLILDQIKMRKGKWTNAYVIESGARKGERENLAKTLGADLIYIEADKLTCLERLSNDKERENYQAQWQEYIEKWFEDYQE